MGAKIKNKGSHIYEIQGVKSLHSATHTLIPDTNEAGTYIIMGIALHSNLLVKNVIPGHLDLVFKKLEEMGGVFTFRKRQDGLTDVSSFAFASVKSLKNSDANLSWYSYGFTIGFWCFSNSGCWFLTRF